MGQKYLKEALIGRQGEDVEKIHPGLRTYDGTYTELTLTWQDVKVLIQSGVVDEDLCLLVTPQSDQKRSALLVVEGGILWNRPGSVSLEDEILVGNFPEKSIRVYGTKENSFIDPYLNTQTPCLVMTLDSTVGISTGMPRSIEEIQSRLSRQKKRHQEHIQSLGHLADVYAAIQTCMAWDTIYEPEKDRVVSPVSRIWNVNWGGFVLFDWDTYFAALMAAIDNKELAYANAIEITREKTERGFIPNFGTVANIKSRDRSQPPVGSMVIRLLFKRFHEQWLLEEVYDDLLTWNRWWITHRNHEGLLCWGSDPYIPRSNAFWELNAVNDYWGAVLESGLDNSPMYDEVPFDPHTNLLQLADVGLNGLYIMDCDALAEIAEILGKSNDAEELRSTANCYRRALNTLWEDEKGIFLNRRSDTGEFSNRISPTNFYALLGRAATQTQAKRMIDEHFYNPDEFWGEWILPSISRTDPAYSDQDYWRGRIWGPMNFLVYLGLRNYELPQARKDLVEKSRQLLLKEWIEFGHIHENYNADTGEGCDVDSSDAFYHWGGLLGLISFFEEGNFDKKGMH
jgi:hypothetical protein